MKAVQVDIFVIYEDGSRKTYFNKYDGIEVSTSNGLHIGIGDPSEKEPYVRFPLSKEAAKTMEFDQVNQREVGFIRECEVVYSFEYAMLAVQVPVPTKSNAQKTLVKLTVYSGKRGEVEIVNSSLLKDTQILAETKYPCRLDNDICTIYSVLMIMESPSVNIKNGDYHIVSLTGFLNRQLFTDNVGLLFDQSHQLIVEIR